MCDLKKYKFLNFRLWLKEVQFEKGKEFFRGKNIDFESLPTYCESRS